MWKKRTLKLTINGISYTNIPGCSTCLHLETCFCPPLHYYSYLTGVKSKVDIGWPFSWSGAKKHHITETVYHCFCWVVTWPFLHQSVYEFRSKQLFVSNPLAAIRQTTCQEKIRDEMYSNVRQDMKIWCSVRLKKIIKMSIKHYTLYPYDPDHTSM